MSRAHRERRARLMALAGACREALTMHRCQGERRRADLQLARPAFVAWCQGATLGEGARCQVGGFVFSKYHLGFIYCTCVPATCIPSICVLATCIPGADGSTGRFTPASASRVGCGDARPKLLPGSLPCHCITSELPCVRFALPVAGGADGDI